MNEPEDFLARWSRRKREADAAQQPEPTAQPGPTASVDAAAGTAEEPAFDLTILPSLDDIGAGTDISSFMKPGVPAALRHAALRRAWTSDPAIRDFRGLQENDWDFNALDGVPGFGNFKSEEEINALAQRLFGDKEPAPGADSQAGPSDSGNAPSPEDMKTASGAIDRHQDSVTSPDSATEANHTASAPPHDDDGSLQRAGPRRHGGALPR